MTKSLPAPSKKPSNVNFAFCRAGKSLRKAGGILARSFLLVTLPPLFHSQTALRQNIELAVADPEALFDGIRNAGAVFLGRHTPEVIGDYVGGSNHVLPTARSARFSSGLSVLEFVKRTSILKLGAEQLRILAPGGHDAGFGRRSGCPSAFGRDTTRSGRAG